MSKTGYLLKNTGILAIGSFSSKLLVFLMVPLYTSALTTAEYGAYDIIYSSVGLLIPVLTLNISDAVLRFPLDEGADIPKIARLGLGVTFASSVLVLVAQFFPGAPWGGLVGVRWLAPLYFANALYQLLVLLARGCERMIDVAFAGIISTVMMLVLNIVLLLVLGMGLEGFFIANTAGMLAPAVYLTVRMRHVVFGRSTKGSVDLLAKMVRYSLPLAATVVGWWFINASGRYVVMAMFGAEATGLFSVAYKVPAILNVVAGVFLQAWQVSAIKEFDRKDADGFLSATFDAVEAGLVIASSALIILSPIIAVVLFSGEFYEGWRYVPLLLVSALFNTMSGMWGPFFSAEFDTAPMAVSTALSGAVNVVACVTLVGVMGVQGAALASVLASLVNWAWRGIKVKRHIDVDFHMGRSLIAYGFLTMQAVVMVVNLPSIATVLAILLINVALLLCIRKSLRECFSLAKRMLER